MVTKKRIAEIRRNAKKEDLSKKVKKEVDDCVREGEEISERGQKKLRRMLS